MLGNTRHKNDDAKHVGNAEDFRTTYHDSCRPEADSSGPPGSKRRMALSSELASRHSPSGDHLTSLTKLFSTTSLCSNPVTAAHSGLNCAGVSQNWLQAAVP